MLAIEKLNSSIAGLQKTIQGLIQSSKTARIGAQPAMLAPNRSQAIPPIALPHVSVGSGKASQARLGSYVQKVINDQVNKAVLDAALNNPSALYHQMQPTGWRGIFGGLKGSPAQQQAFNRIFNGAIGSDIVRDGKLTPQAQAYFKNYLPKSQPSWLQQKMPGFFPT